MYSRHVVLAIIILILYLIEIREGTSLNCGKRLHIQHTALISDGSTAKEGDWPWHAGIFHTDITQDRAYKCGGTVLNANSILTAAHCVFENNRPIINDRIIVNLGTHSLIDGTHTQQFEVQKVFPHPDYNTSTLSNDIAIIRLATEATLNNYVQPICLWDSSKPDISDITGRLASVIGWGATETNHLSLVLRQARIPVVSHSTCLDSNSDFYSNLLTEKNFCAGFRNGTSVCNGDSGGSLSLEDDGVHYIRGIVSLTTPKKEEDVQDSQQKKWCHVDEYVIFTDVVHYLPWIQLVVPQLKPAPIEMETVSIIDTGECGNTKSTAVFSNKGAYPKSGQWPWLAPLFTKAGDKLICESNIINNQYLLSVAHCFQNKEEVEKTSASNIYAYLGGYDLNSLNDSFALKADIKRIIIHPDWNPFATAYDGDIALLRTKNVIAFTDYIQPVCLPTATSTIFNLKGIVVGNQKWELSNETHFRQIKIKSVKEEVCLLINPSLASHKSQRMFCAGEKGSTPCSDESGAGFYVKYGISYGLIGLVSSADCHKNKYALFTSVPNYIDWIFGSLEDDANNDSIDEDGKDWKSSKNCNGDDDVHHHHVDTEVCEKKVRCFVLENYESGLDSGLKCKINLQLKSSEKNCTITFDEHANTKVIVLTVLGEMDSIPEFSNALDKFENIGYVDFGFLKMKNVERTQLKIFKRMSWLSFYGNQISELAADTFDDLIEMEKLLLAENRLKVIHPDLFKELRKLTELWLQKNQLEVLPDGLFRSNKELKTVFAAENKLKIISTDFRHLTKLVAIDFNGNKCINEWCSVDTFCGTSSKAEMQKKIWNKCKV